MGRSAHLALIGCLARCCRVQRLGGAGRGGRQHVREMPNLPILRSNDAHQTIYVFPSLLIIATSTTCIILLLEKPRLRSRR